MLCPRRLTSRRRASVLCSTRASRHAFATSRADARPATTTDDGPSSTSDRQAGRTGLRTLRRRTGLWRVASARTPARLGGAADRADAGSDPAGRSERRRPESNRCTRLCRPLRSHSATAPGWGGKGTSSPGVFGPPVLVTSCHKPVTISMRAGSTVRSPRPPHKAESDPRAGGH